jgi:hypothetical protein
MTLQMWTATEDALLIDLSRQGLTAIEAAVLIGRSPESCHSRRRRLRDKGILQSMPKFGNGRKPTTTPRERLERLVTVITRIDASVPVDLVLGDDVVVAGRQVKFIAYSPDGELVCVDEDREVVVVGKYTPDAPSVALRGSQQALRGKEAR